MEIDGERGGGEAKRRGRSELRRLLEAIESSEVLEKRITLIKQLEEFSADDLGLILQGLLASWIDSTCSGVSHCTLHRSILQVALKFSDLDITEYLGQFFTLGAKASSWCGKHLQWSVISSDQSGVIQEDEHNRLCLEVNSLSFSISTKLLRIAAKCIAVLGLEVAAGEGGKGAVKQESVLNMAAEQECVLNMAADLAVRPRTKGVRRMAPWSLTPVVLPPPQETSSRRCTQCGTEKTPRWLPGPDGPGTLCNACGLPSMNSASAAAASSKKTLFREGRLLRSNSGRDGPSKKRRLSSKENSAAGNATAEACHGPSVKTVAVEVEEAPALDAPRASTKVRRRVTATETTSRRQANVLPRGNLHAEKETVRRRCTHCATEESPQWREGPEGPRTLCNACGVMLKSNGRLLPEYRPANSPGFSPLLHSNKHRRVLEMHRQNKTTSACPPANGPASFSSSPMQRHSPLRQERLQSAGHASAEACRGGECVEVQLLPERPPVDRPAVSLVYHRRVLERPPADRPAISLVYHRRVLERSRKSEQETFAVIRATAKAAMDK